MKRLTKLNAITPKALRLLCLLYGNLEPLGEHFAYFQHNQRFQDRFMFFCLEPEWLGKEIKLFKLYVESDEKRGDSTPSLISKDLIGF